MSKWKVLRVVSITGCCLSICAAIWVALGHVELLRGLGSFWTGVAAACAMYFVIGYSTISVGWRQSEEGALILALVGMLGALATSSFIIRVFIAPPASPTLLNVTVTIVFAWMMVWLAAVFTRRQVDARRASNSRQ